MAKKSARKQPYKKGRRSGSTKTRDEILEAAIHLFSKNGFHGSSLRNIAARAGVDVALISHFFGSKESLFMECMRTCQGIFKPLLTLFESPTEDFGEQFVRTYLGIWETHGGSLLISTVRSSFPFAQVDPTLLEDPLCGLLDRFSTQAGGTCTKDARIRTEMIFAILFGLLLGKYVIRSRALAETDVGVMATMLAPAIEQLLAPNSALGSPPTSIPKPVARTKTTAEKSPSRRRTEKKAAAGRKRAPA